MTPWAPAATGDGSPYGNLDDSKCKEEFSLAFTHAIATAARCVAEPHRVDVERVDVLIKQEASHTKYTDARVEVQLKCTSQNVLHEDGIHWPLTKDHYDHLRDPNSFTPQILVVVLVPDTLTKWTTHNEDHLLLHQRALWLSLRDSPEITTASKTVVLPRNQIFNVEQLLAMLQRIGNGGHP